MKLTDHFSWDEMTRTSHEDLFLENKKEAKNYACAIYLTANLMERVRAIVGSPIRVTSGFRGPTLNARVGGLQWDMSPSAEGKFTFVIHPVGGNSYGWSND